MSSPPHEYTGAIAQALSPLSLLTAAFFLMVAFQTFELVRDRFTLVDVRAAQEQPVQRGIKLRQQMNAVVSGISQLADGGDANAKAIIDDLQRQGIQVRANPAAAKR
jgi:hypothetical protein